MYILFALLTRSATQAAQVPAELPADSWKSRRRCIDVANAHL